MTTISNIYNKVKKQSAMFCAVLLASAAFVGCVDNDFDDGQGTFYSATKRTAAEILSDSPERFSSFKAILERANYYAMLGTYGKYTVFAPDNNAINTYMKENGYKSLDSLLADKAKCDTIARTHIVNKGAYFTTEVNDGALPKMNMDDRYLVMTSENDEEHDNKLMMFVNKRSQLIEPDDSTTNGVLHVIDRVITPSNLFLPDLMKEDENIKLFVKALERTNLKDSLTKFIDETYSIANVEDSVVKGVKGERFGNRDNTTYWPEYRYFKYTAFVEPDEVFIKKGLDTVDKIADYAKQIYDQVYPEDAGKYDHDPTDRRNPLNRFVAYHLMDRIGNYGDWAPSGKILNGCCITSLADPEDFWETMCPYTMIRFCRAGGELYANRKGLGRSYKPGCRGVKVLSPSESGKTEQNALNGTYHYLDDILTYDTNVRDNVLNCRFRIDSSTLSADFMNQGCRFNDDEGESNNACLYALKPGFIKGWKITNETRLALHAAECSWSSYLGNAIMIKGQYDVQFKLPPVPEGTYEIRIGYVAGEERGVVQVYLNNEPCDIPVDLTYGRWNLGEILGNIDDDPEDEAHNAEIDKTLHNLGYMKAMDSYKKPGDDYVSFRINAPEHLRRVLAVKKLNAGQDYYLRFRQVSKGDKEWSFDYIELCPKDIYASPEGEDRH